MPELARILSGADEQEADVSLDGLVSGPALLSALRLSLHPAHVAERVGEGVEQLPTPAVPFCVYQGKLEDGAKVDSQFFFLWRSHSTRIYLPDRTL